MPNHSEPLEIIYHRHDSRFLTIFHKCMQKYLASRSHIQFVYQHISNFQRLYSLRQQLAKIN